MTQNAIFAFLAWFFLGGLFNILAYLILVQRQKSNKDPTIAPHWVVMWAFVRMTGVLYIAIKHLEFISFDPIIIKIVIADLVWSFLAVIFDWKARQDMQRRGIFRVGQSIGSLIFSAVYFGYYFFG